MGTHREMGQCRPASPHGIDSRGARLSDVENRMAVKAGIFGGAGDWGRRAQVGCSEPRPWRSVQIYALLLVAVWPSASNGTSLCFDFFPGKWG